MLVYRRHSRHLISQLLRVAWMSRGPGVRGMGLGLAAPSMSQTGKQHKDTHTSTQGSSAQGSASGYLGPDALGFLFQLTLLRAHGKAGEQGPSVGEWEEWMSAPQPPGCLISIRLPSCWSLSLHFLILISNHIHAESLTLTGLSNVPK